MQSHDNLRRLQLLDSIRDSGVDRVAVEAKRESLLKKVNVWRIAQSQLMPSATSAILLSDSDEIEREILYLPSDFDQQHIDEYGLRSLANTEMELLKGEAYDALELVRQLVKYASHLGQIKIKEARGVAQNTRAAKMTKDAHAKKRTAMNRYREARRRLLTLSCVDYLADFPELKDSDTWRKDTSKAAELGDGRRTEGWIWSIGVASGASEEEQSEFGLAGKQ
jgi:hypothetical protein